MLNDNKMSLEQVFLRLTETSDNEEARKLLGVSEEQIKEEETDNDSSI